MKTEQEEKDTLKKILFEALTNNNYSASLKNAAFWEAKVCEICANVLIKNGYGDVSEYKEEIESRELRSKCYNYGVWDGYYMGMGDNISGKVNQKLIAETVLNMALDKVVSDGHFIGVPKSEIEKLIKEVRDGEDKG